MTRVRINKYLSDQKICSRRKADRLIQEGKVFVNGKLAELGQKIDPKKDVVEIKGGNEWIKNNYKYIIFNKPLGVVSHKTSEDQVDVKEYLSLGKEFAPVGRLDKNSTGLLLISNDGRIVDRLLNPRYEHEKEYIVTADKYIKNQDIKKLARGVNIEGYMTLPATVKRINDNTIRIILKEGKKHQVRRMLAALGYVTKALKRVRIMNIKLGSLRMGEARELTQKEKEKLLRLLGLD